jgi:hypothetical protein
VSATRVTTVTIHCNHQQGCPEHVSGSSNESDFAVRKFLRRNGWLVAVPEGHLVADYCPRHHPDSEPGAAA